MTLTRIFAKLVFLTCFPLCSPHHAIAGEVMVVGTAHLAQLKPKPSSVHLDQLQNRLAAWQPSLVCVEAMPPQRIAELLVNPAENATVLSTFAMEAVRLGPEQQLRLGLGATQASLEAQRLVDLTHALNGSQRVRLISLLLAAYDLPSAVLNWVQLDRNDQEQSRRLLGDAAVAALRTVQTSTNEIYSVAVPLAAARSHKRLCSVDSFVDEVAVQTLGSLLLPALQNPGVGAAINSFNAEQNRQWVPLHASALVDFLAWLNGEEFVRLDRDSQWQIFAGSDFPERAGLRRLALWHARNADISAHLFRALASPQGSKVLLLIGAAHRPFIEAGMRAQPWVTLIPAGRWLQP